MQLTLIMNAWGGGEGGGQLQLGKACDCWKRLSALHLTQEVPQYLAEVGPVLGVRSDCIPSHSKGAGGRDHSDDGGRRAVTDLLCVLLEAAQV